MRRFVAFVIHRRWWVIAAAAVFVPLCAVVGGGVAGRLSNGGFDDPASESSRGAATVLERFGTGEFDFVMILTPRRGDVDGAAVTAEGRRTTEALAATPGVAQAVSYWSLGSPPPLRSKDSHRAIVAARLAGDEDQRVELATRLVERFDRDTPTAEVALTGASVIATEAGERAESDLRRSELISTPVVFVALVAVFGSLVAALLPLAVALVAVVGTFLALTLITGFTDVSVFALNLTTGLGLGLAIDYSLFIVARYREELERGLATNAAIGRAMQTAGRTVGFSAGTVMVSMLALLVFPIAYLRSFAFAGLVVVPLAALSAIVLLPALLAVLGPRIDAGRVFRRKPRPVGTGFWHNQATRVMAHPWLYLGVVTLVLLALAAPFRDIQLGRIDDRVLPASAPSRIATDQLRSGFTLGDVEPILVLVEDAEVPDAKLDALARRIASLPGVERVDGPTGYYLGATHLPPDDLTRSRFTGGPGAWLSVVSNVEPISVEGERLARAVRAVPSDLQVRVAGPSAALVDTKEAIRAGLPAAIAIIVGATLVLLFMMTGSVVVPFKALLLNLLSLTATFGGMVWVFQQGHLAELLDFTPTGTLDTFTPVLMFCIAFGLSMDYEVFLLSRMKEEYDMDRDNQAAVAVGLERTGRVVTAAALLLAIVFVAISMSGIAVVKLFGLGLTVAVLVDAFLIRATLVPALMRLAGRTNWWAPGPMRRFHLRHGIWENEPIAVLDRLHGLTPEPAEGGADGGGTP